MVRQEFYVEKYWRVIVYYNVDYTYSDIINSEFKYYHFAEELLEEMWYMLTEEKAKAVTCSDIKKHVSIILFNRHKDRTDYINSVVHEAEHVKQAMFEAYEIEDKGEPPAYTIGYLVMRMYKVFQGLFLDGKLLKKAS